MPFGYFGGSVCNICQEKKGSSGQVLLGSRLSQESELSPFNLCIFSFLSRYLVWLEWWRWWWEVPPSLTTSPRIPAIVSVLICNNLFKSLWLFLPFFLLLRERDLSIFPLWKCPSHLHITFTNHQHLIHHRVIYIGPLLYSAPGLYKPHNVVLLLLYSCADMGSFIYLEMIYRLAAFRRVYCYEEGAHKLHVFVSFSPSSMLTSPPSLFLWEKITAHHIVEWRRPSWQAAGQTGQYGTFADRWFHMERGRWLSTPTTGYNNGHDGRLGK